MNGSFFKTCLMPKNNSTSLFILLLGIIPGCGGEWTSGPINLDAALYAGHYNRFHNAIRVRNTSQNLADALEAQCGANNPRAAAAAGQARAAAQEIDSAIAVFNDTDTSRITNAVADAHKANEAAYNQYLACGGTPPPGVRPGLPGYSETFWDISS
jgi:hypothetical protein